MHTLEETMRWSGTTNIFKYPQFIAIFEFVGGRTSAFTETQFILHELAGNGSRSRNTVRCNLKFRMKKNMKRLKKHSHWEKRELIGLVFNYIKATPALMVGFGSKVLISTLQESLRSLSPLNWTHQNKKSKSALHFLHIGYGVLKTWTVQRVHVYFNNFKKVLTDEPMAGTE